MLSPGPRLTFKACHSWASGVGMSPSRSGCCRVPRRPCSMPQTLIPSSQEHWPWLAHSRSPPPRSHLQWTGVAFTKLMLLPQGGGSARSVTGKWPPTVFIQVISKGPCLLPGFRGIPGRFCYKPLALTGVDPRACFSIPWQAGPGTPMFSNQLSILNKDLGIKGWREQRPGDMGAWAWTWSTGTCVFTYVRSASCLPHCPVLW